MGKTYSSGFCRPLWGLTLGDAPGARETSVLVDRVEEDLGRELVIVNWASSGSLLSPACKIVGRLEGIGRALCFRKPGCLPVAN